MNDIFTVTQLNLYLKNAFDSNQLLRDVWIKGEISNYKSHYSGHMYFTLKDEGGLLKCVMFKFKNALLKFIPDNGMKVIVRGKVSVYERDGTYQMYAEEMQPDGLGNLHLAFEQLKLKLEKEGLFNASYKKKIPFYPGTVAAVTSSTGAVIRDIINVAARRNPGIPIKVFPVAVQGDNAALEIVNAIEKINRDKCADVIIIGRGGGSLEDLWAFNEEIVARSIFKSALPVISAVGHETDFTIADFVADLRAPTPSAAAEIAFPDRQNLKDRISVYSTRLKVALANGIKIKRNYCEKLEMSSVFRQPLDRINNYRLQIDRQLNKITQNLMMQKEKTRNRLSMAAAKLNSLSPLKVISRGYSVAFGGEGKKEIVRSVKQVKSGDSIDIMVSDGYIGCSVTGTLEQ
jgi:exodeoxyribonuclease VII large subunit